MKINFKKIIAAILLMSILFTTACSAVPQEKPELSAFMNHDVQSVIELIDSIEEASFETEAAIEAAYVAYYELESDLQVQVSNFDKLVTLRNEIADLYEIKRDSDRIDRSRILMGTYGLGHTDEEHISWLAECGIDFVVGAQTSILDLLNKYDIGAIPTISSYGIPSWKGDWRTLSEELPNPPSFDMEYFASQLPELSAIDHEAIWGMDIVDEPDARDFWFHEGQRAALQEKYPNYFTYINLYCELNGPASARLGAESYQEYIDTYVETVNTDFICFDCYMYRNGNTRLEPYLDDIMRCTSVIANACREHSRDFWMWLQISVPDNNQLSISLDQIRYETNMVLAFGVTSIIWSVWETGWWENRVLDADGNKTERYDSLKTVIAETDMLSPVLMKYKSVDNAIIGFKHPEIQDFYTMYDNVMDQDVFVDFSMPEGTHDSVLCGYFEKKIGEGSAMMFVNITDPDCETKETSFVRFKVSQPEALVTEHTAAGSYVLTPDADGYYKISVENAEYSFVTVE